MKWFKKRIFHRSSINENVDDFSPRILNVLEQPPMPMPGLILRLIALLVLVLVIWASVGQLDIVARAEGKLIPQTHLKVIQPFEGGRIDKILVHEGQTVKKGQSLVVMDNSLSQANTMKISEELATVRLQLRRVLAELELQPLVRQIDDTDEQFESIQAQYQAHRQTYLSTLSEQQAVLEGIQHELKAQSVVLKKLEILLPLQKETEANYLMLSKEGYASKQVVVEKQQARIEAEKNFKAQEFVVQALEARISESRAKIHSIETSYQQKLQDEKTALKQKLNQLTLEYAQQQYRNGLMELKAPQDGIVMELATHTEGTIVPSGSVVIRLVPLDDPLKAEVYVSNQDVGFIGPEQTARVKLSSYQFQKYGMIDAVVERVSADALSQSVTQESGNLSRHPLTYKTLLHLNKQRLERDGRAFDLRSGMHVTAEIILGKRTILEYLLSPIQKTLSEAGRER